MVAEISIVLGTLAVAGIFWWWAVRDARRECSLRSEADFWRREAATCMEWARLQTTPNTCRCAACGQHQLYEPGRVTDPQSQFFGQPCPLPHFKLKRSGDGK